MSSGTTVIHSRKACGFETTQIADLDRSLAALETQFRRDHFFYVENGLRASERRFSVVRHGFQRTLPVTEAFQTIRIGE
jgi:hypothetical protein